MKKLLNRMFYKQREHAYASLDMFLKECIIYKH